MYFVNKEDNFYMCDETIRFLIFIKEKKNDYALFADLIKFYLHIYC